MILFDPYHSGFWGVSVQRLSQARDVLILRGWGGVCAGRGWDGDRRRGIGLRSDAFFQRIRRELRRPNRSWRVDETYVRVAGNEISECRRS
jgi:hypothetical protein